MEFSGSTEFVINEDSDTKCGRSRKERIIAIVLLVVAFIILVVGVVLIAVASTKNDAKSASTSTTMEPQQNSVPTKESGSSSTVRSVSTKSGSNPTVATTKPALHACAFSEEAQNVGLGEFLGRVKSTYYKLHPYDVVHDPDATADRIKREYVAYDPTPSTIKNRTDTAQALLKEIRDKSIKTDLLKLRERKALAQVKHFLQHVFGHPYDVNYYDGDWMMGPNLFCWQPICDHGYGVYNGIGRHHKPYNADDVKLIESKLKTHKAGFLQYIENMKMGVRRGMIRSTEECEAGNDAIKRQYLNTSRYNETGEVVAVPPFFLLTHFYSPEFVCSVFPHVTCFTANSSSVFLLLIRLCLHYIG